MVVFLHGDVRSFQVVFPHGVFGRHIGVSLFVELTLKTDASTNLRRSDMHQIPVCLSIVMRSCFSSHLYCLRCLQA